MREPASLGGASGIRARSLHFLDQIASLALIGVVPSFNHIDLSWRLRARVVAATCGIASVTLWSSLWAMSGGRVPCPQWINDRVPSRLVAGLDLRGGLRLVYNVEGDEAIRDKRDRYYEEMRTELARIFGLHSADGLPSEQAERELAEKLTSQAPRQPSDVIRVSLKDGTDRSKLDAPLLERFRDSSYSLGSDQRSFEFRVKAVVRGAVRASAVNQARQIILRRVDELGLREASVSTRDEDALLFQHGSARSLCALLAPQQRLYDRLDAKVGRHDFEPQFGSN